MKTKDQHANTGTIKRWAIRIGLIHMAFLGFIMISLPFKIMTIGYDLEFNLLTLWIVVYTTLCVGVVGIGVYQDSKQRSQS